MNDFHSPLLQRWFDLRVSVAIFVIFFRADNADCVLLGESNQRLDCVLETVKTDALIQAAKRWHPNILDGQMFLEISLVEMGYPTAVRLTSYINEERDLVVCEEPCELLERAGTMSHGVELHIGRY